jgi:SAM-dependent methyltransferase
MGESTVPERFAPAASRGQLVEAEHLARYWWAGSMAEGRRVLDAGCGTAYGSRMLAESGAAQVVGVDRAATVVEEARDSCPETVDLVTGDLRDLPFGDRSFDLVVCFEVIEHVEDPEAVLRELERVVTAQGVVLVSTPNRDVYEPGNPHHVHEYAPEELRQALERRFAHVELRRQANLLASAIMPDDVAEREALAAVHDVRLAKCVGLPPGLETYTLALASHAPLAPDRVTTLVATGITEIRRWLAIYDEQQAILERQGACVRELTARAAEVRRAREALLEDEAARARAVELEAELREARADVVALERRLAHAAAPSPAARWAAALRGRLRR